jgi:hypothetical protein
LWSWIGSLFPESFFQAIRLTVPRPRGGQVLVLRLVLVFRGRSTMSRIFFGSSFMFLNCFRSRLDVFLGGFSLGCANTLVLFGSSLDTLTQQRYVQQYGLFKQHTTHSRNRRSYTIDGPVGRVLHSQLIRLQYRESWALLS